MPALDNQRAKAAFAARRSLSLSRGSPCPYPVHPSAAQPARPWRAPFRLFRRRPVRAFDEVIPAAGASACLGSLSRRCASPRSLTRNWSSARAETGTATLRGRRGLEALGSQFALANPRYIVAITPAFETGTRGNAMSLIRSCLSTQMTLDAALDAGADMVGIRLFRKKGVAAATSRSSRVWGFFVRPLGLMSARVVSMCRSCARHRLSISSFTRTLSLSPWISSTPRQRDALAGRRHQVSVRLPFSQGERHFRTRRFVAQAAMPTSPTGCCSMAAPKDFSPAGRQRLGLMELFFSPSSYRCLPYAYRAGSTPRMSAMRSALARPGGVDVSSGVEICPHKNPDKVGLYRIRARSLSRGFDEERKDRPSAPNAYPQRASEKRSFRPVRRTLRRRDTADAPLILSSGGGPTQGSPPRSGLLPEMEWQ